MPALHLRWALALLLLSAPPLQAQGRDALPLPRGAFRVEGHAGFAQWRSRFGAGGAEEDIGSPFALRLSPDSFGPLEITQVELTRFFRATDARAGMRSVPEEATLGTATPAAVAERTRLPFFVEVGATRRIAVGLGIAVEREAVEIGSATLAGAVVGVNPDPTANRAALAALDPAFGALGGARFLPDSASALGQELLRRANLLAGGNARLRLPRAPLRANAQLGADSLPFGPLAVAPTWRARSASAGLRVQLLGGGDTLPRPRVRSALLLRTEIPIPATPPLAALLAPLPEGATPEVSAGLRVDVVASQRFWVSAGARFTRRWAGSVELVIPDSADPLAPGVARALRADPGDGWDADMAPRFQLTESIGLGGTLAFAARGADAVRATGGELDFGLVPGLVSDRSATTMGFGGRYTTVPAWQRGSRVLPLEAEILFHRTISGRGVPRASGVEAMARVYGRVWGGRRAAGPGTPQP